MGYLSTVLSFSIFELLALPNSFIKTQTRYSNTPYSYSRDIRISATRPGKTESRASHEVAVSSGPMSPNQTTKTKHSKHEPEQQLLASYVRHCWSASTMTVHLTGMNNWIDNYKVSHGDWTR